MSVIAFSENSGRVQAAFKDYMNHYLTEYAKREGFPYEKGIPFAEKERKIDALMREEIQRLSGFKVSDGVSVEMLSQNPVVRWAAMAVSNFLVDTVVPDVLIKSIGAYTEERIIGYGDSASFTVEPMDLFYVSKAGRNQRTVEFQKQFPGQVTVVPENREITVAANFYKVLSGMESMAKFTMKAVLSLEAQISRDVYTAFAAAFDDLETNAADLVVTGYSEEGAIKLLQTVEAWNGGAKAIFMGTKLAVRNLLPADGNYRYSLDSDYAKIGYVKTIFDTEVMAMPQVAKIGERYKTVLDDTKIFVVCPIGKPVKLVFGGNSFTTAIAAQRSADLTETTTMVKAYGIAIAASGIAGVINLE